MEAMRGSPLVPIAILLGSLLVVTLVLGFIVRHGVKNREKGKRERGK